MERTKVFRIVTGIRDSGRAVNNYSFKILSIRQLFTAPRPVPTEQAHPKEPGKARMKAPIDLGLRGTWTVYAW